MITYDVNLCIGTDNPDKRLSVKCHDTGVNLRVHLQVCKHGKWRDEIQPYIIPAGVTAVLKIVKPDKKYCITEGNVGSNNILFVMNPQAFTVPGISKAEVSIFAQDGKRVTSGTFSIDVPEECVCGCDLDSENYIDVMSEQIRAAIDAADRAEAAVTHGPIIKNGTWWLWNPETGEYEDSGVATAPKVETEDIEKAVNEYLEANPTAMPYIGENGNWFIGETDTGVPATGGSGGLSITDDNEGNVTITSSGSVSITDDGEGNVVIA